MAHSPCKPGSVLEWLLAFPWCPSIEGRGQITASRSERRRQLEQHVWTITGFSGNVGPDGGFEPIRKAKPGPDDPMPALIAEVTMCKGKPSQRSFYYDHELVRELADVSLPSS